MYDEDKDKQKCEICYIMEDIKRMFNRLISNKESAHSYLHWTNSSWETLA